MSATQTIHETSLKSLKLLHRGKVRDLYAVDAERLLIVQTDRLSAFDVILPTPVPGKGRVLTEMSNFWFRKLRHVIPNHLLDVAPETLVTAAERGQVQGAPSSCGVCNRCPSKRSCAAIWPARAGRRTRIHR
jgi:phosphoribosylaminoimidazole-succinocarboxamide synthase